MYFNTDRKRTGSLFQGTFRAEHADTDAYLKYLFSYIHLNPVKLLEPAWRDAGIQNPKKAEVFLSSYPYSSYIDYLGSNRAMRKIVNKKPLPEYFPSKTSFKREHTDWIRYADEAKPREAR